MRWAVQWVRQTTSNGTCPGQTPVIRHPEMDFGAEQEFDLTGKIVGEESKSIAEAPSSSPLNPFNSSLIRKQFNAYNRTGTYFETYIGFRD